MIDCIKKRSEISEIAKISDLFLEHPAFLEPFPYPWVLFYHATSQITKLRFFVSSLALDFQRPLSYAPYLAAIRGEHVRAAARSIGVALIELPVLEAVCCSRGDGMVNAGAVSEGCSNECQWLVMRRSNTRRRPISRTPHSTAHDAEFCFASCARPNNQGLRAGPAPSPPQSRLWARNLAAAWSFVARERFLGRRPQAQGALKTTARPRWLGRTACWR